MTDTSARLDELENGLEALAEVLERHGELLKGLSNAVERGHWDPSVPEDLEEWVDQLTATYYLADDLAGWAKNTAIVEELKALRVLHRAMVGPKAPAGSGVQFHDALARVVDRITTHRQHQLRETP